MKHVLYALFLVAFAAQGQTSQIDLSYCNDIRQVDERNQCLQANIESLLMRSVAENFTIIKLQVGDTLSIRFSASLSKVGLFSIESVATSSYGLVKAAEDVLYTLKPLDTYRDRKGRIVSAAFEYAYTLHHLEENKLHVLDEKGQLINEIHFEHTKKEEEMPDVQPAKPNEKTVSKKDKKKGNDKGNDTAFAIIEEVPIFPGCTNVSGSENQRKCMSKGIAAFIGQNFNAEPAVKVGLVGTQRISVQFRINETGFVDNVTVRAPHPILEAEARRVITSLPRLQPGRQRGKTVGVLYSLPINFVIEDDTDNK